MQQLNNQQSSQHLDSLVIWYLENSSPASFVRHSNIQTINLIFNYHSPYILLYPIYGQRNNKMILNIYVKAKNFLHFHCLRILSQQPESSRI